ncbi:hypothetical protein BDEG_23631 [Batrachochytrium dendrobatidis JEL423]|uniref:EF-hand domain-containing protein n=1 Tax=Batrachochytrium dendrobatidis (strain JEL423) TaxID=403673 RepID=A0A177WJ57_BATDL|nr:hypothetical protein BDEG_23631 [Batrachochytrium dendrobatidis JEL423]
MAATTLISALSPLSDSKSILAFRPKSATQPPNDISIDKIHLSNVKSKYQMQIFSMRIRLVELFQDFDKLRSGLMTVSQFRRCLAASLDKGVVSPLSKEEIDILQQSYIDPKTKMVRWREFVDSIDTVFGAKQLEYWPTSTNESIVKPFRRPLSPNSEASLAEIISILKSYVKHHGSDVKSWFKDFDKYNNGYVTYNQFRRGIPQNLLSMQEEDLLLLRYGGVVSGTVNYFKMNTDVNRKAPRPIVDQSQLGAKLQPRSNWYNKHIPVGTEELVYESSLQPHNSNRPRIDLVEEKIKKLFTKNHLERDPLFEVKPVFREWLMTDSTQLDPAEKVRCAQIIGSRILSTYNLSISDDDLHILFKKYEDREQGKVKYMEFIRDIDPETYTTYSKKTSLGDSKQTSQVEESSVSSRGSRLRENNVDHILTCIRNHVGQKRIRISEFFKDFDKLRSYSIRREEFIRGLGCIGLNLSESDSELVATKYMDHRKKNYCKWKEFEQDIDKVFGETHLESRPTHNPESVNERTSPFVLAKYPLDSEEMELLKKTMNNICEHLRVRQCSVKPFFRDLDKVCTGTGHVTKSQFRQCLTYMNCNVTDDEFQVLCKHWTKSNSGVEQSEVGAEKHTNQTKLDFIQDVGQSINYVLFLEEIERGLSSKDQLDFGESRLAEHSTKDVQKPALLKAGFKAKPPIDPVVDEAEFEKLMMRIKIKAKTERIRVIDFMADFDHLKHGKITRNEFRRAIKVLYADLTEADLQALETQFKLPQDPKYVNYIMFSNAIESVFTKKGLEKNPTEKVDIFNVYSNGWEADPSVNVLSPEDNVILQSVLDRLAKKVNERRIDALSYMEDYDFVKEGTITTNQFRSVLNSFNLGVTDKEMNVLTQFLATNKTMTRLNYRKLARS